MMRALLLTSLMLNGCATKYYRGMGTDLKTARPNLVESHNFAFVHQGDEYFFAPDHFREKGADCYLYLGFKNGKLAYAFPYSVFVQVQEDYTNNDSPDQVKGFILKRVAAFTPNPNRCYEARSRDQYDGQGSGIAILLFPIFVPVATALLVRTNVRHYAIERITDKIKLGMTPEQIPEKIRRTWVKKMKGKFPYFEWRDTHLEVLLYFEDGKLNAWTQADLERIK